MQVDAHTHILSLAEDPSFTTEYGREGSLCIYRSAGKLPAHRMPTEEEWEASGFSRAGFPVIGVPETIRDHPGFDKIVILAISPQFLDGELIGTVDSYGITDVPGPPSPEKCNDYIAALQRQDPSLIVGYASVNPDYRGPKAAVRELERAVTELGLQGVKLYPMYQDWSPADPVLAFPVFEKAEELGVPVMVHQAGSTRIDARMEYARPALLDAAGRQFRGLRLTIAHVGLPWVDEALFMLTKHPNFFTEVSYYIATATGEELYRFLVHAQQFFVPLEKLFFGTDYPGFLYDPVALRAKLLSVNSHAERLGTDPIPQAKLDGIMGDNFARMMGWLS
jgi:predicted TIM-barrel fold metal-dependent hydrolase